MKKTDWAMIILIASVSALVAYFIANTLIGRPTTNEQTVKTIEPITAEVTQPDPSIFNRQAVNPTVQTRIGDSDNRQPFGN